MEITKSHFGYTKEGQEVYLIKLDNGYMTAKIVSYGCAIQSLIFPDKNGQPVDVVLGFDTVEGYENQDAHIGATIGRYANRIEGASFELNGKTFHVDKNEGENHLHGGTYGFDRCVWDFEILEESVRFFRTSPDGEEGYPGALQATVEYRLAPENALEIHFEAVSDADTLYSPTNHAYFNLAGHNSGTALNTELKIYAENYTVNNNECLPTGEILPVKDTPMDFTSPHKIGERIDQAFEQLIFGKGYDNNWVLDDASSTLHTAAEAYEPATGITLLVKSTFPGVQFYSGNHLGKTDPLKGKDGALYTPRQAFCLEPGLFPNAMKHRHFPSPVLKQGEKYSGDIVYALKN